MTIIIVNNLHMLCRFGLPVILLLTTYPIPAQQVPAQQEDAPLKLKASSRLVEVVVTVRDAHGKPVPGLTASDFTITDNGKPRPFTVFSFNDASRPAHDTPNAVTVPRPTKPPLAALPPNTFTNLHVALPPEAHSTIILLDAINGWFENFAHSSQAVQGLMSKVAPDEKIALYVISKDLGLNLLQDYTTDRAQLTKAVATFLPRGMEPAPPGLDSSPDGHGMFESARPAQTNPTRPAPVAPTPGETPPPPAGGPPPPDASKASPREHSYMLQRSSEQVRLSLQALAEKLRMLPGRKSVFWITEGFPPIQLRDMNQFAWAKTFSALNDANIEVNTIDNYGLGGPPRYWSAGGILTMQRVADETGGEAFFHRNDLDAALAEGVADTRVSYTLGFYVTQTDGTYHELKVRTATHPNLQLNYRQGYWARTEEAADLESRKSDLESVQLSPMDLSGIGITVTLNAQPASLGLRIKLDPESLTAGKFKDKTKGKIDKTKGQIDKTKGQIEELFIESNAVGYELAKQTMKSQFVFNGNPIAFGQSIPRAPGATKLRIVIRDPATGKTGSLTIPIPPRK